MVTSNSKTAVLDITMLLAQGNIAWEKNQGENYNDMDNGRSVAYGLVYLYRKKIWESDKR